MTRTTLPLKGSDKAAVLARLGAMVDGDMPLDHARFNLLTPYGDDRFFDVGVQAMHYFAHYNAMFARIIPSVGTVVQELKDIALSLQHAPEGGATVITAGGTESIFTACWAARTRWQERNPGSSRTPEILGPNTMHAAFQKSALLLGMKCVLTEFDGDFRGRPQDIENHVNANTAMIVGSAPAYPHGVFDPIADFAAIAQRHGVWMHVDACVGGYVSPFAEKLGIEIPPYDFRVPGVWSMSADLHKHAYVPKGISTLIYRDADLIRYQTHVSEGWPYGNYTSTGFAGSRPSHVLAAAWAILNHLGEEGYLDIVAGIYRARQRLMDGISAIPGMRILGKPESSVFTFLSDDCDCHAVAELMDKEGWLCFRILNPRALHIQCDPFDDETIDRVLESMRRNVEIVRKTNARAGDGKTGYR